MGKIGVISNYIYSLSTIIYKIVNWVSYFVYADSVFSKDLFFVHKVSTIDKVRYVCSFRARSCFLFDYSLPSTCCINIMFPRAVSRILVNNAQNFVIYHISGLLIFSPSFLFSGISGRKRILILLVCFISQLVGIYLKCLLFAPPLKNPAIADKRQGDSNQKDPLINRTLISPLPLLAKDKIVRLH